jgi:hypothetical protein
MTTTKDGMALGHLSKGLSAVAVRMEAGKATEFCAHAADILTQAMNTNQSAWALRDLSKGLSAVAVWMEPGKAAQACAQAAAILTQAMNTTQEQFGLPSLSEGLSAVAVWMEPGKAVTTLAQAMNTTKDGMALYHLSLGLSAVAARMEPGKAAEACAHAAAILIQAWSASNTRFALVMLPQGVSAVLAGVDHPEQGRRAVALTEGLCRAAGGYGSLACLPLLRPALEPLPCRISTPQLVELLKHPLFVNEARRIVLDQLGHRYQRRFADLWDFIAWAKEHKPELDLTTPPQRPGR